MIIDGIRIDLCWPGDYKSSMFFLLYPLENIRYSVKSNQKPQYHDRGPFNILNKQKQLKLLSRFKIHS